VKNYLPGEIGGLFRIRALQLKGGVGYRNHCKRCKIITFCLPSPLALALSVWVKQSVFCYASIGSQIVFFLEIRCTPPNYCSFFCANPMFLYGPSSSKSRDQAVASPHQHTPPTPLPLNFHTTHTLKCNRSKGSVSR